MLLKDKVVLVTGSTTGIGAAIAKQCILEGAYVMIHGRNEEQAKAVCAALGKERTSYVIADLAEADSAICANLIKATVDYFGALNSLVNNAGGSARHHLDSVTTESFDWSMRLNARAPLFLIKAAVEVFRKQNKGGTVVNIGSINAYCGQSDLLPYSMAKGALMTMTRNLGNALAKEKIRINQLNVGWTLTPNESKIKEKEGFPENWEAKIPGMYAPSGKLLRPEEVARHVVFWVSDISAPANAVVYELEQYPMIGRNLINEISLDIFK